MWFKLVMYVYACMHPCMYVGNCRYVRLLVCTYCACSVCR